jgi:hypothetical protein
MEAPPEELTLVEFLDSSRIPSVSFQCDKVMNDPPVETPGVKLTFTTTDTSDDTLLSGPAAIPPPDDPPTCIPPAKPPPLVIPVDVLLPTKCFPSGSMVDDTTLDRPTSPTMPFEFPFDPKANQCYASMLAEVPDIPSTMDSVTQVVSNPQICGLTGDTCSHVRVMQLETVKNFSSMVDGGANICLTGMLSLLVDVVTIPPMQISVAIEGWGDSLADCCTKRGLLPITLDDGGVYYQPCYFCANAVETILSPQAILDGSNLFV